MFASMMEHAVSMHNTVRRWKCLDETMVAELLDTYTYVDRDRRKTVTVTFQEDQPSKDRAQKRGLRMLSRNDGLLDGDVYNLLVKANGVVKPSGDPNRDDTRLPLYVYVDELGIPVEQIPTLRRDRLEEVRRITPDVDVVCHLPDKGSDTKLAVFKYYYNKSEMFSFWSELQVYLHLPAHPNLLNLNNVVVDETHGLVVGFTTPFVKGGNWLVNQKRAFKRHHLRQLFDVVDFVNMELGIVHQDIAARNLMYDEQSDNVILFDWDCAAPIGYEATEPEQGKSCRNDYIDIVGVVQFLYHLITGDERHINNVRVCAEDWEHASEVKLDAEPAVYRQMLRQWIAGRQRRGPPKRAALAWNWKTFPQAPVREDWNVSWMDDVGEVLFSAWEYPRRWLLDLGEPVVSWERPSAARVAKEGLRINCAGQVIGHGIPEHLPKDKDGGVDYVHEWDPIENKWFWKVVMNTSQEEK